jgi:CRISPR-associated endonuclease/helicase Cas3
LTVSEPLLAKSALPPKTLLEHTCDVMDAVKSLFGRGGTQPRLGEAWQRFFRLEDYARFVEHAYAAAALHDWGKANAGFQDAVRNRGDQSVRHEHLSALLLDREEVRRWLRGRPDIDQDVVLAAVLSHHLKASHETLLQPLTGHPHVQLLAGHGDFRALLEEVSRRLSLGACDASGIPPWWSWQDRRGFGSIVQAKKRLQARLYQMDRTMDEDKDGRRRRMVRAVRAGLIAADAVGSAEPRLGQSLESWIRAAFDPDNVCTAADVRSKVIAPRVEELRRQGRWDDARGAGGWGVFQEECARLPERALLLAPCGSGKTLAAWRWIEAQLGGRPAARVLFLYPTRATATEGFKDYVSWAPEAEAALVHGTASYDLEGMFDNPADRSSPDPREARRYDLQQRLFALALWQKRIFSATVDQFLGFLQYGYGPVCTLPVLADSVVVIDEVHSFDRAMFSALKQFLRSFKVPALCMTATLPAERVRQLSEECGLQVYNERPDDLTRIARYPRYRVCAGDRAAVPERIRNAIAGGRRVLWVVNQVRRAQEAVRQTRALLPGLQVLCYHSRFKLDDRRDRHREVIEAFQGRRGPSLAVTTQVCEMSLDLDADLLVTEQAPVTSLIQRMGRCNRRAIPEGDRVGEVVVYAPEDGRPYEREMLQGAPEFVADLAGRPAVSQADLERALEQYGPKVAEPDRSCRFLDSGPYAMAGEDAFRDIEEFHTPCVLDSDVAAFLRLQQERRPTAGLVVPVPRKVSTRPDPRLPRHLQVAPHRHYAPDLGFCDDPVV